MNILLFLFSTCIYALCAVLVIELICWVVGIFLPVPTKVKQILYAIVGLCLLLNIVTFLLGGGPLFLPYHRL